MAPRPATPVPGEGPGTQTKERHGMKKDQGGIWWRLLLVAALCVGLALALSLAGCGGKEQPVETDVTEVEPLPPPPQPEPVEEPEPVETVPAIDYAAVPPQEYGIEDVFFAFDKYDLSGQAMSKLQEDARIMKGIDDVVWLLEGHCDERGTIEYNLALGEKRANAVRDYLVSLGVPTGQLRVTSYGESKPFAYGHDEQAWAANRRVHFALP